MHLILKRLITPLALLFTVFALSTYAESIRIIGPDGSVQPSARTPQQVEPAPTALNGAGTYGPTRADETLWSIASKLRPSRQLSIQQTLLAVYKLNPQAFDNQNIHELIPGSRLRVPSINQIQAESTSDAVRVLQSHQARLTQSRVETPPKAKPAQVSETFALPTPQPIKEESVTTAEDKPVEVKPAVLNEVDSQRINELKEELNSSEGELIALEEKNHQLRLMLSQVQEEVGSLKDELGDESRIRSEVEKLLEEERKKAMDAAAIEPSMLDVLLANTWFVALLALIPGLLFVLIIVLILTRKGGKTDDAQQPMVQSPEVISLMDDDDEVPEINLDEDLDDVAIADDLFGDNSDENIFDVEDDAERADQDDIFANLDDSDMDFNLDDGEDDPFAGIADNGDFDTELEEVAQSSNGISVNADDKALSLEEMERALDEDSEQEGDDFTSEFDLSDDGELSQDDLNELLAGDDSEPLDADELDQSDLDALFNNITDESGTENDDELESFFSQDEELDDFDLSDPEEETSNKDSVPQSDEELDDTFSESSTALLDELLEEETDSEADEESDEFQLDDDSVDLLDDVLESDLPDDDDTFNLEDNNTALLDELLDEPQETGRLAEIEEGDIPELDEESTELLDELLDESAQSDDESGEESELDPDELLENFGFAPDEAEEEAISALDEESTELLDELVEESAQSDDESGEESELDPDELLENFGFAPDEAEVEATSPLDEESTELLDELVEESAQSDDESGEESELDPDELLENFGFAPDEAEEEAISALDEESTELSDELLEESVQSDDESDAESELDLDEFRGQDRNETDPGQFSFEPHIEGSEGAEQVEELDDFDSYFAEIEDLEEKEESEAEPKSDVEQSVPQAKANEFGIPQDDDWLTEEEREPETEVVIEDEIEDEAETKAESDEEFAFESLSDEELGEFDEQAAIDSFEQGEALEADSDKEPETDVAIEDEIEGEAETQAESDEEFAFESLSDEELGEFDEQAAIDSFEQDEGLEADSDAEPETDVVIEDEIEDEAETKAESDEEFAFESLSDEELGEFDEQAAIDSFEQDEELEATDTIEEQDELNALRDVFNSQADQPHESPDLELDSLFKDSELMGDEADTEENSDIFQSAISDDESFSADEPVDEFDSFIEEMDDSPSSSQQVQEPFESDTHRYDEAETLSELLNEDGLASYSAEQELSSATIDSAGMDIDTMLESDDEDWNGFELSPEQKADIPPSIPDDQLDIWRTEADEAIVQEEDWGDQSAFSSDKMDDKPLYTSVDELMAQADIYDEDEIDPDDEDLKLDVGLDEFPDVLGNIAQFDVDSNAEAAGKLDLAKIYIEMNDQEGAIRLLEEAMLYGEDDIHQQAKALLDKISK